MNDERFGTNNDNENTIVMIIMNAKNLIVIQNCQHVYGLKNGTSITK